MGSLRDFITFLLDRNAELSHSEKVRKKSHADTPIWGILFALQRYDPMFDLKYLRMVSRSQSMRWSRVYSKRTKESKSALATSS